MARTKYDGVIEAVRYSDNKQIDLVRFYERRQFAFSDHMVLTRAGLVERIKKGKRIVTGQRKPYQGNDFKIERRILLRNGKMGTISTDDLSGEEEHLTGVPVF